MKFLCLFLLLITSTTFAVDKTYKASSGNLILDASGNVVINKNLGIKIVEPENSLQVNGDIQVGNMTTPALIKAVAGGGGTDFALQLGLNFGNENTSYGQIWMEPYVDTIARKIYFKRRPANDTGTAGITMTIDGVNDKVLVGLTSSTDLQPNDKIAVYTSDGGGINFSSSTKTKGWTIRANGTRLQIGENEVADRIFINAGGKTELSVRDDGNCGIGNICSGTFSSDDTTFESTSGGVVTASTSQQGRYTRVGNVVDVTFALDTMTINATSFQAQMSIPIASNFTGYYNCGGTAALLRPSGGYVAVGAIYANATSDKCQVEFINVPATGATLYFVAKFSYTII